MAGYTAAQVTQQYVNAVVDRLIINQEKQKKSPNPLSRFLVADTRLNTLACRSVCPSVTNIFELRAVFALRPLPNRPRLSCRVSGLVIDKITASILYHQSIYNRQCKSAMNNDGR